MSRRQKLEKFQAISQMPHVYQNYTYENPELINHQGKGVKLAGRWNDAHFQRKAPLVLELACGRGEYSLGLAALAPENNYVGIDIKGARIHQGATRAQERQLEHVAFVRTKIECIEHFFGAGEVDTIWIIFPDPFLKSRKANRRLTAPVFLRQYRRLLKPGGTIKLKTDSPELYVFTHEVIATNPSIRIVKQIEDLHTQHHGMPELDIITYYEKMHIADGRKINYLEFEFDPAFPSDTPLIFHKKKSDESE